MLEDDLVLVHASDWILTEWLEIRGDEHPLDITGHFPVLAGYDTYGNEIYLANVHSPTESFYCLTYVSQGAQNVSVTIPNGKTLSFSRFRVLVLRYDPCDVGVQGIPKDAKFQTGPVYWIRRGNLDSTEGDSKLRSDSGSLVELLEVDVENSPSAPLEDRAYVRCAGSEAPNSRFTEIKMSAANRDILEDLEPAAEISVTTETESFRVQENTTADVGEDGGLKERDTLFEILRERHLIEGQRQMLRAQRRALKDQLRELEDRDLELEELQATSMNPSQAQLTSICISEGEDSE